MYMQGAGFIFTLSHFIGAAALLFLCAVFLQRIRMRKLEEELDSITLKFQQQAASPKSITHELFDHCPYPMCSVDTEMEVLAHNAAFGKVTREPLKNLSQFDQMFGTTVRELVKRAHKPAHKQITLRIPTSEQERQFYVVVWPIMGTHSQVGSMLAFHEQTFVAKRRQSQAHFEQQLVEYTSFIGSQIDQLVRGGGKEAAQLIHAYSEEMKLLSGYLEEIHTQVRSKGDHSSVDIGKISRTILEVHRADWRRKNIHLVSSFPVKAQAVGREEDIILAIKTLFTACLLQTENGGELRYSVHKEKGRIHLEWHLPSFVLNEKDREQPYSFGSHERTLKAGSRQWRLHSAIARELFAKYNGILRIESEKRLGTTYTVTLVVADTK